MRELKELLRLKKNYIDAKREALIPLRKELSGKAWKEASNKWMRDNRPAFTNEEKERINIWLESNSFPARADWTN